MESAGDFEPASDGVRLDSRLFGIQGLGALLMGTRGGVPTRRSADTEECRASGAGLRGAAGGRVGCYARGALCPC